MKALIADAHTVAALECVRSLGRRGVEVVVAGEEGEFPLASLSRYCAKYVTYPSPFRDIDGFVRGLRAILDAERPDCTIVATDGTLLPLAMHRAAIPDCANYIFPPEDAIKAAFSKVATIRLAGELRIPIPPTVLLEGNAGIHRQISSLAPPFVVKPVASHLIEGNRVSRRRHVAILNSMVEVEAFYRSNDRATYPIVQEWRPGAGVGVAGIYRGGEPLALFSHRRIREESPLGGRACYCESIPPDERLTAWTTSLMSALGWSGPAMVEYRAAGEQACLMEINGRLWGSLPLAVAAGIDFPWILCRMAMGDAVKADAPYAVGRRGRYLLADIRHLLSVMKGRPASWVGPYPRRMRTLAEFFASFFREATYFTWRRDDPMPGARELARYLLRELPAKAVGRG